MSDYILVHHGIKGQKWGVRRFQNSDGSLTDAGSKRYGIKILSRHGSDGHKNSSAAKGTSHEPTKQKKQLSDEERAARRKKAIKIGTVAAGTAVVAVGAYTLHKYNKEKKGNTEAAKKALNLLYRDQGVNEVYDRKLATLRNLHDNKQISASDFNRKVRETIHERDYFKDHHGSTDMKRAELYSLYKEREATIHKRAKEGKLKGGSLASQLSDLNEQYQKMVELIERER